VLAPLSDGNENDDDDDDDDDDDGGGGDVESLCLLSLLLFWWLDNSVILGWLPDMACIALDRKLRALYGPAPVPAPALLMGEPNRLYGSYGPPAPC